MKNEKQKELTEFAGMMKEEYGKSKQGDKGAFSLAGEMTQLRH